jgi:DNA-binding response OmpR family regulator
MTAKRVLIVEDDPLISMDVEQALAADGYEICGAAASQDEALALAERTRPEFAVVDVNLSPGDGRLVALALRRLYGTVVLMASGNCSSRSFMSQSGASACLPKPYAADIVARALEATEALQTGHDAGVLPDHMFAMN